VVLHDKLPEQRTKQPVTLAFKPPAVKKMKPAPSA